MDEAEYDAARESLLSDDCESLIELEKSTNEKLLAGLKALAPRIQKDFDATIHLTPFWKAYAPLPRGHKPKGDSIPWGEVGEKVVEGHLYSALPSLFSEVRFIGLPYGHDVRVLTSQALLQIDAKSTGPTDNPDEVVASPNQVTGDGVLVDGLVTNSQVTVQGIRSSIQFRPELPPFYILEGKIYPCLTFYVKLVYSVTSIGHQPLDSLELVCVPNGLMMFVGPKLAETKGFLIPGKDQRHVKRKRTRIRLDPLAELASWRCHKIRVIGDQVQVTSRKSSLSPDNLTSLE